MAHSLRKFIGKVPLERGLRRDTKRRGRFVHEKSSRAKRTPFQGSRREITEKINKFNESGKTPERYGVSRFKSVEKAWEIMKSLEAQETIPTAIQLTQALAFRHGLSQSSLLPWINAAVTLKRLCEKHGETAFTGNMRDIYSSVSKNVPEKAEKFLRQSKKSFNVKNLAGEIGGTYATTNTALQILDAMGLVKKLPFTNHGKTHNYLWVHTERMREAEGTNPRSPATIILKLLQEGEKSMAQLTARKPSQNTRQLIQNLILAGLTKKRKNKGGKVFYSLTPEAEQIMELQKRMPYLHPELRKIILGERKVPLPAKEIALKPRKDPDTNKSDTAAAEHANVSEKTAKATRKERMRQFVDDMRNGVYGTKAKDKPKKPKAPTTTKAQYSKPAIKAPKPEPIMTPAQERTSKILADIANLEIAREKARAMVAQGKPVQRLLERIELNLKNRHRELRKK